MEIANFEKLRVYQFSLEIINLLYKIANKFPKDELFSLTSQLKRAGVSIVLNIAESQGRSGKAEKKQFLLVARGSIYEIFAILEIAVLQDYISISEKMKIRDKLFLLLRQLNSMINFFKDS